MTNDQNGITYEERADEEHTTAEVIQSLTTINDTMPNDQKATQHVKFNPDCEWKTSTIDKLLTPELLDHILRTTTRENSIREKGNDNFSQLNTLMNTGANGGGT